MPRPAYRAFPAIALPLLLAASASCRPGPSHTEFPPPAGVAGDVARLASPEFGGRLAGTPGDDSAAAFIAQRYQALGLRGAFPADCGGAPPCAAEYFQFFRDPQTGRGHNVAALVPGADPALRDEYVVVGAHLDHLGRSTFGALDANFGPVLHPGADDNASGTAAVLELARRLASHPTRRPLLLVNFDAEELGLLGSAVFVDRSPVPTKSMALMVNLDMVGRLGTGPLIVDSDGDTRLRALVDSAAAAARVRVRWSGETRGRSDQESFERRHVPTIVLFTGFHADYHRATDVATRIDVQGLLRVVDVAEGIVRSVGNAEPGAARFRR
jgi:hypothetical protein